MSRRATLQLACGLLLAACTPRVELRPTQPLDASPAGDFRTQPPEPLPARPRDKSVAQPVHLTLPNGLQIFVIERPALPLMTVAYVNRKAVRQAQGRAPGLAVLTGEALLAGGTKIKKDVIFGLQIGGVKPSVVTSHDYTAVFVTLPPRALSASMKALARIVRNPAFDAAGVRKAQLRHVRALYDQGFTADAYTDELFAIELYGADHPWAVSARKEGNSVTSLTREELFAYHANVYRPSASAVLIAGAVDPTAVEALARKTFGRWVEPKHSLAQSQPEFRPQESTGRIEVNVVPIRGDESHILLKQPAVSFGDPDVHALRVLAYVLGGGFTSRAQLRLRHNAGITYGVQAGLDTYDNSGTFWVRTTASNDRLYEVAQGLSDEIERLQQTQIALEELKGAQAHYRSTLDFADNRGELEYLAKAFATGQGADAVLLAQRALETVTVEDVQRVARQYLPVHPKFFILTNIRETGRQLKQLGKVNLFVRKKP